MPINEMAVIVDTFTNSRDLVQMVITHKPTGLKVAGEGQDSRLQLKEILLRDLGEMLRIAIKYESWVISPTHMAGEEVEDCRGHIKKQNIPYYHRFMGIYSGGRG